MCLYPKLIKNRKYTKNKKNGGKVPPLPLIEINGQLVPDKRVLLVPVGCQKCMECKRKKAKEWQVRLTEDIKTQKNGVFVTLTFSDISILKLSKDITGVSGYNRDNEIATLGVRRFLERWRKKYKKSVRHWLVTELGHNGTENIHLHGIIWTDKDPKEISKIWKYGFTWLSTDNEGYVNEKTVNYIVKYINKVDPKHKTYESKILTSAGIGGKYKESINFKRNKFNGEKTNETYINRQGYRFGLPIYYRNQLYTDEQKEKLWQIKLDQNIRWVDGVKVDISNTEEGYYRILEEARRKNKRLGFNDDTKNWELKKYEQQKRNINYIKRIKRALARDK